MPTVTNLLNQAKRSFLMRSIGGILFAGMVNNAVSFVMTVLAARALGPGEFALLGVMLAVMMFGSTVFDCGTSVSLVRSYQIEQTDRAGLMRAVLRWKYGMAAVVTVLAWPLAPLGCRVFFGALAATHSEFVWAIAGAGLMAIWMTVRAAFQAREEFRALSLLTYAYAAVRTAFLGVSLVLHRGSATDLFLSIYVLPLLVVLPIGTVVLWRRSVRTAAAAVEVGEREGNWRRIRDLLTYGRWVALSAIAYAFLWRLPQFRLSHGAEPAEVGYYSAGLTFIAFFSLLNDSVRTVILPKVAGMQSPGERVRFRGTIQRWAGWYFAAMASLIVLLWAVQVLALGNQYRQGIPIFLVLSVGTVVTLYAGLLNSLVHAHGLPHLDAATNVMKVAALGGLLFVVPADGLAVAVAFACVMTAGEWALVSVVRRHELRLD